MDQLNDEALATLVQQEHSKSALAVLYNRYHIRLVRFAAQYCNDIKTAEDIVHDSFIKLIKNADQFNTNKLFTTWIYTIVRNESINHVKINMRRAELIKANYNDTNKFTNSPINHDAHLIKHKMLQIKAAMSEKELLIYNLRIEQELSIKEVSQIACLPEGSVKSTLFYLLKKIAKQLNPIINE